MHERVQEDMGHEMKLKSGLKQGCILSIFLFNPLMEKTARSITARPEGFTFINVRVNCLGYADDIDIKGAASGRWRKLTTQFKRMACHVGLEINEGKTEILEVARTPQLQGNVDLAGIGFKTVETFKCLDTIMSQNTGMAEEVIPSIGAANRCYFSLIDLLKRRPISRKIKLRIYNTVIRRV
ncbi:uncharacterized protein [Palaemon carinicauda]|uniref:uncharacterized protein n=1 Tax=Palaemon carinicauda TaxID=392227 RepID=UPI0035B6A9E2